MDLHVSYDPYVLGRDSKPIDSSSSSLSSLRTLLPSFQSPNTNDGTLEALQAKLITAKSYNEWLVAARRLDQIEGNDVWKSDPLSEAYNFQLIQTRIKQLRDARYAGDMKQILFIIRTTFSRNSGGIGNLDLYCRARTGTKALIEEYIGECIAAIAFLLASPCMADAGLTRADILDSLICTRQTFGRTALLLSGGATFGMAHIGVIQALYEADLLPRIISGASAGSIVAAVVCTRTDDEIPALLSSFAHGDLDVFDDEHDPEDIIHHFARFLKQGAWMDIKHMVRVMKGMMGDVTFQEAHNRTRKILNIGVSSTGTFDVPRILNYITAPNVIIWSAVAASCSLPLLFTSSPLYAKDSRTGEPVPWNPTPQRWIDGSVDNDLPMTRLSEMFNVNHFIVSQVNPHVVPFLPREDYRHPPITNTVATWGATAARLLVSEGMHRMTMLAEVGLLRTPLTKLKSILSQRYSGDITILPELCYTDITRMLKNPTPEFMMNASLCGQRATWPKLTRIQSCCAIELALDRAITQLRSAMVFSPSGAHTTHPIPVKPRRRRVKTGEGYVARTSGIARSHSTATLRFSLPPLIRRIPSDSYLPVASANERHRLSTRKSTSHLPDNHVDHTSPKRTKLQRATQSTVKLLMTRSTDGPELPITLTRRLSDGGLKVPRME